jgi:site-specific recombinase XerD
MPAKRFESSVVTYFTEDEIDALLGATDQGTWTGRRDRAMLALACQTGLRASGLPPLDRTPLYAASLLPQDSSNS